MLQFAAYLQTKLEDKHAKDKKIVRLEIIAITEVII